MKNLKKIAILASIYKALHKIEVQNSGLSKNESDKNKTINILKECYEKDLYNSYDLIDISKDTDKEIEVNDFIKDETLEKEYDYFD